MERALRWPVVMTIPIALGLSLLGVACDDDGAGDAKLSLAGVLGPLPVPADNPQTAEKVELGKALFFDARLSGPNTVSCASCHVESLGWSDGKARNIGASGEAPRNSQTLWNVAYYNPLGWSGNRASLEEQVTKGLPGKIMAQPIPELLAELAAVPEYKQRFEAVFGPGGLTVENLSKAIAAFERTLVTYRSPFDRFRAGDEGALSAEQRRGMELFFSPRLNCGSCHTEPLFTDNAFHGLGVPQVGPLADDPGRLEVTKDEAQRGAFRTPTLRNVTKSAPYMHDGVFATLAGVVDFYAAGGGPGANHSPLVKPFALTADEKKALLAFLDALTDEESTKTRPPDVP